MQTGCNILVVDDEDEFRETMAKIFRHRGVNVDTADGCIEALDKLRTKAFEVVIMDISMPGVNGIQCLGQIKQRWPSIEVIILTGHASVSSGIQGMEKGAFDYCLKPIDPDELFEKIKLAWEKVRITQDKD